MQLYYVHLNLNAYDAADVDAYVSLLLDYSAATVQVIRNTGRQVIPLVVKNVSGTKFVKSNGIVMLQPGTSITVEDFRLDRKQMENLKTLGLVNTQYVSLVVNQ